MNRWTSAHPYGLCLINHDLKHYYINVPKCASSWIKTVLDQAGRHTGSPWVYESFTNIDLAGYTALIALRDPVSRWVSHSPGTGVKLFSSQTPGTSLSWLESENFDSIVKLMDSFTWDEHTNAQRNFLPDIVPNKSVFFWCDRHMSTNFIDYLTSINCVVPAAVPFVNESSTEPQHIENQQRWKQLLQNPDFFPRFQQLFAVDYELIESVKFYQANSQQ